MNELISIVVPVYNGENDIGRCLESIRKQTYQNIEVIIIDDGSTDGTCKVCEEFALNDNRINIIRTTNCGVSVARNIGLNNISGNYFTFIDADDVIKETFIEIMFNQMKSFDIDMVICGVEETGDGTCVYRTAYPDGKYDIRENYDVLADLLVSCLLNTNWNKLYKKKSNVVRFKSGLLAGEDLDFNLKYLKGVSSIAIVNSPLYKFKIDKKSSIRSLYRRINFDDFRYVWKNVFDFFEGKVSEKYHKKIVYKYVTEIQGCFLTDLVKNHLNPINTIEIYKLHFKDELFIEVLHEMADEKEITLWLKWNINRNYFLLVMLQYCKYFRNCLRLMRR
ncbi:MAG: glycosyltransferase family 2 protein [Clostridiales bacterium]|nr:glycosyltransferase family 2 protein [Clostridiales bacterium]